MRSIIAAVCLALALGGSVAVRAQHMPLEPLHNAGQGVTGAFEGWFPNQDGTFSLLFGYYNRNQKESLDIPAGPNNRIEPGGPDQGQPTHFLPGRVWGVFTITVPKDFGSGKLTWTLVDNGQTSVIPASLDPLWEVSPFRDPSTGNTPPVLKLENGESVQGPRPVIVSLSTSVSTPLPLSVALSDDAVQPLIGALGLQQKAPPLAVTWIELRGPGLVTFANAKPPVQLENNGQGTSAGVGGKAATTATFSQPGEYLLLVVANDWSGVGGHGYQCCWTNAHVKVTVRP